ncbi:MAG: T9SS type A sorting domain-containing protein [Saprospiraceae bacterium]|nr:T9SS type A sorting domain-containing protein [Saprospiraceae bacterium]
MWRLTCILTLFLGISTYGHSQSITRGSLTSAGGLFSAGGNTLTWTLAETVVGNFDGGTNGSLSNGQQQVVVSEQVSVRSLMEEQLELTIYPNPTTQFVNLEVAEAQELQLQLLNSEGKLLQQQQLNQTHTQLDFSQLPAGSYWLSIQDANKTIKTYQISKL